MLGEQHLHRLEVEFSVGVASAKLTLKGAIDFLSAKLDFLDEAVEPQANTEVGSSAPSSR